TLKSAGIYGTALISQELLAWILAMVFNPCSCAIFQCRRARGPGPIAEMEYSPTLPFTPPRSISKSHSLTLISNVLSVASAGIIPAAQPSGHPQSHTISFGGVPAVTSFPVAAA